MGRVKLKIRRLESLSSRQITYGKRRAGILKKAQEISVLCDIDIILLMFSPTGKPSIFRGHRSNIDEIIAKFAQLTPKERAKRRLESLETLKRNFKKLDQDVDIDEFLDASTPSIEELQNQAGMLRGRLAELHEKLRWWTNPDKIDDIEHLNQMEDSLRESLNRIRVHKHEYYGKDQLILLDSTSQFQNEMHDPDFQNTLQFPQDDQAQSWLPNGEPQHMMLPSEPNFMPHQRSMECPGDASSLPSCSGFFDARKGAVDFDNSRQIDNDGHDGVSINHFGGSADLTQPPLSEQYSYHAFGNLGFPGVKMLEPERESNFQESVMSMDYHINGGFELPRPIYSDLQYNMSPATGFCAVPMHNEKVFPQPSHDLQ